MSPDPARDPTVETVRAALARAWDSDTPLTESEYETVLVEVAALAAECRRIEGERAAWEQHGQEETFTRERSEREKDAFVARMQDDFVRLSAERDSALEALAALRERIAETETERDRRDAYLRFAEDRDRSALERNQKTELEARLVSLTEALREIVALDPVFSPDVLPAFEKAEAIARAALATTDAVEA